LKALFICDQKDEWTLLTNLFHAHFTGVELICALKGSEAIDTLSFDGPFGMIIIECGIKDADPTDLAEEIFDTVGPRPLLFVGTPAMIKDRVREGFFDQYEMVSIYNKPYKPEEITTAIQDAINWAKQQEFEESIVEIDQANFLPLKLRNFYLYEKLPFDVYIELTKTKYILAIKANKNYTQSQIQDYQKRNIKTLYLEKNEHLSFLENSISKIQSTLRKGQFPSPSKHIQTIVAGVLVVHQYIRDVGVSETLKEFVDELINQLSVVFKKYNNLEELLLDFPMEHGDLAEQAVLKGLICEFLTLSLGWKSNLVKQKTGLSAILHDSLLEREEWATITYKDHPDLDFLSEEQRKNFIDHPKRAAEISRNFSQYTEVDFIIDQHHEQPDGSGFPLGLHTGKITQVSSVFILASNLVTHLVINGITAGTIRNILSGFSQLYNVGTFKEPLNELIKELKKK
ncbi:unnamed protein product, partial [Chrysoparadoxa australica]